MLIYLEGKQLLSKGIADMELFRKAVASDPSNTKALETLRFLQSETNKKGTLIFRLLGGSSLLIFSFLGFLFLRRNAVQP